MNKDTVRISIVMHILIYALCIFCNAKEHKLTNVILITLDTVRADHLTCYGYNNIKTPALDSLARNGTLFEKAISSSPITLPSHASILTGLYPFHSDVRNNVVYMLPDNSITLATILKKNGYHTAAFISAAVLRSLYNLNQGFEVYDERLDYNQLASGEYSERKADSVTKVALEWLNANKNYPYFAWIHYFDAHAPYEPPDSFLAEYKQHLYDGEIAYVDLQLIDVIKFAKAEEKAGKQVLIIVVADHGEGLWDHGEPEHGIFLYQETVQVPLIFTWFPKKFKSSRIAELVRTVDILPTILNYLSIPFSNKIDGTSLLPLIEQSKEWKHLYAYSETLFPREDYGWSQLYSIQDNNWKYILAPKLELYDINNDKTEKNNLYGNSSPAIYEKLKQHLASLPIQIKEQKLKPITLSPEETEKLASLGYAGQPRTNAEPLPDPKDQLELIKLMHEAGILFMKKQYQGSISLLLKVVKKNADNRQALITLSDAYFAVGNIDEAIKYAEQNIQIGDSNGIFHFNLGNLHYRLGNSKNAELYYRKSIEINPNFPNVLFNLAVLELQKGEIDAAKEHLLKAMSLKFETANAYYLLGAIEAQNNDLKSAIEHFNKTVKIDPLHSEGWKNLAHAYYIQGEIQKAISNYQQAIKVRPDDADLYLKIASIYFYDLKDKANALYYYKKTIEIAPNHPDKLTINQMITTLENK
jgi:arylsulfatase A-like enzyme/Flp pilus assembly protein TadD